MLPSRSYKALLNALQKAETIIPRPDRSSSGDDWSLYLRLLKLLSSVQTLHRKAERIESDKRRNGKPRRKPETAKTLAAHYKFHLPNARNASGI